MDNVHMDAIGLAFQLLGCASYKQQLELRHRLVDRVRRTRELSKDHLELRYLLPNGEETPCHLQAMSLWVRHAKTKLVHETGEGNE